MRYDARAATVSFCMTSSSKKWESKKNNCFDIKPKKVANGFFEHFSGFYTQTKTLGFPALN